MITKKANYLKIDDITVSLGNGKLDKSILIFNLPAVTTCPNCDDCKDNCYAYKCEKRYPSVRPCRERNYKATLNNSGFIIKMLELITVGVNKYGVTAIRVHESGDFYSQEYANNWNYIAGKIQISRPDVVFFAYTKSPYRPAQYFNIVESILPDGSINFGDHDHVIRLAKKYHATICPYGISKIKFKCGLECKACQTKKYVVFHKH